MTEKDHGPRIGADPEIFVQTAEGQVVPICGKIGGTKDHPLVIDNLVDAYYGPEEVRRARDKLGKEGNYAMQEDNVMLEFNVPAYPSSTGFLEAIDKILNILSTNVLAPKGLSLKHEITHTFKTEELISFPQAFDIGCLADMNAYADSGEFKREPFTANTFGNHRFCGGHLHIQYNTGNVPPHVFVQFMDLLVSLPSLRWDKQKLRRMFYGQPGIYREKPYGIEYRTPSNFWLSKSFRDNWMGSIVDTVLSLAHSANSNPEMLRHNYSKIDWHDVQQAIKTENIKLADELIDYARSELGIYMSSPATR